MTTCQLTEYYLLNQSDYGTNNIIPVKDDRDQLLTMMDPTCFGDGACEGSIKLIDGRLLNVSGKWLPCDPSSAAALKQVADERYKGRYSYVGLSDDFTQYLAFNISNTQWGVGAYKSEPLTPFFTCAVDPKVFPLGSTLYSPSLFGIALPNGQTHNGYLWAIDEGGAIQGSHIDLMTGSKEWAQQVKWPATIEVELSSMTTTISAIPPTSPTS